MTLLYIQGHTRGWWVGLSSPDTQSLLLNRHLSFQRGGREKKISGCVNWAWTWASAGTKLWEQIWKISQKHLVSHLTANSTWLCMCTEQEASLSWQRGCGEMVRKKQVYPRVWEISAWGLQQNHLTQGFLLCLPIRHPSDNSQGCRLCVTFRAAFPPLTKQLCLTGGLTKVKCCTVFTGAGGDVQSACWSLHQLVAPHLLRCESVGMDV